MLYTHPEAYTHTHTTQPSTNTPIHTRTHTYTHARTPPPPRINPCFFQVADACGEEADAYEFLTQAFIVYEEEISEQPAKRAAITLASATLTHMGGFSVGAIIIIIRTLILNDKQSSSMKSFRSSLQSAPPSPWPAPP